jgi:hypothetical protein
LEGVINTYNLILIADGGVDAACYGVLLSGDSVEIAKKGVEVALDSVQLS